MNSTDAAGNLGDDVDIYDWDEDAFKPNRETAPQTSQSREVSPKTFREPRIKSSLNRPESFDEIGLRLSNEFAPVIEEDADTLVYIGVPPPTPGQDPYEYDYTERLFKRPYLMKSATLRAVGSPKFEKYLGPMSARTARKLKKLEVHKSVMQPHSIRYYVDASPALNDDEALIQLTELTVPQGALKWHQLAKTLDIPRAHVDGRDELNVPARPTYTLLTPKGFLEEDQMVDTGNKLDAISNHEVKAALHDNKEPSQPSPPVVNLPLEEEYTALRHHTATARLFQALAGNDPKLNSAAKAWTFCMLAKYFDCAHSPLISHWIVSWLLEKDNSHFIQHNPEIAFRIATATQSTWLIRCTFAILVGQQAMIEGANEAASRTTGHSQSRRAYHTASCLDDDDINRIDHAASALTYRIRGILEELAAFPGIWNDESSPTKEIARLNRLAVHSARQSLLQEVKDKFRDYVRRMIYMTLSPAYDLKSDERIGSFKAFDHFMTYSGVPQPLKLLTRHFWSILRQEKFARDYTDTRANHEIWEQTQAELKQQGIITGTNIPYVSRKELFAAVDDLNEYLVSSAGRLQGEAEFNSRQGTPKTSSPAQTPKSPPKKKDWCCLQCGAQYDPQSIHARGNGIRNIHCVVCGKVLIQDEVAKQEIGGYRKTKHPTEHQRGIFWDSESLLQKLSDSSLGSEPVAQKPMSPVTDLSGGVTSVADKDDDRLMADIPPPLEAPLQYLSIRQKSLAATPQVRFDPSVQVAPTPVTQYAEQLWPEQMRPGILKPLATVSRPIVPFVLLDEIGANVYSRLSSIVLPGYVLDGTCDFDIPNGEISTLLCLNDNEWKYLPLWAGGLDDGTGGVFNDGVEVPDAPDVEDGGFRGGAMGIIPGVGSSIGGSMDGDGSEFEEILTDVGVSTVGKASRIATDGTATDTVMSMDE